MTLIFPEAVYGLGKTVALPAPPSASYLPDDSPVLEMDDRDGIVDVHDAATKPAPANASDDSTYIYSFIKTNPNVLKLATVPQNSPALRFLASARRDQPADTNSFAHDDKEFSYARLKDAPGFPAILDSLDACEIENLLNHPGFQDTNFARYLIQENHFDKRLDGDGDLFYLKRRLVKTLKVLRSEGTISKMDYKTLVGVFKDPALSIWDMVTAELLICYAIGPFVQYAAKLATSHLIGVPGISAPENLALQFPTNPLMWAGYVLGGTIVSFIIGGTADTFKYSWPMMTGLRAVENLASWDAWQSASLIKGAADRVAALVASAKTFIAHPTPEFETPKNLTLEGALNFVKAKYHYLRTRFGGVAVEREYPKDFKTENLPVTWLRANMNRLQGIPVIGAFLKSVSGALPSTVGETKAYSNNLFITNILAMVIFSAIQMSVNAVTNPNYDPTTAGVAKEIGFTAMNAFAGWVVGCIGNLYITMNSPTANRAVFLRQVYSIAQTVLILAAMIPNLNWEWQQGTILTGGMAMLYGVTKFVAPKANASSDTPSSKTAV